jgi:hypothetical protein
MKGDQPVAPTDFPLTLISPARGERIGHNMLCPYKGWSRCSNLPRGDTRTERLLRRPPKAYNLAITQGGRLDSCLRRNDTRGHEHGERDSSSRLVGTKNDTRRARGAGFKSPLPPLQRGDQVGAGAPSYP